MNARADTAPFATFRFGDCTVDSRSRSVVRAGKAETPEPKVFDLIVFLIRNRARVVKRHELLAGVWGHRVVLTPGVVARAVMKARRLIGDDPDDPKMIRTVHRVGYRFVAPAREEVVSDSQPRHPDVEPPPQQRVAIVTLRPGAGADECSWIELGVVVAASTALSDRAIDTVAPAQVIALPQTESIVPGDRHALACSSLGASDLVGIEVVPDPENGYRLSYAGWGPCLTGVDGTVVGADVAALAQQLVSAVVPRMPPQRGADHRDMAAPVSMSDGQLARECHHRALQAMNSERWGQARKLLQVALDIEPQHLHRQLDFAQCLVRQRDIGAGTFLGGLMVRIVTVGDDHARMQCLHVQALHCRNVGQTQEAGRLLTAAIEIAESRCDEQAELQLLVTLGETLVREGTPGVASWILDRALDCATRLNDTAAIGRLQDIRGRLQMYRQEFEAAAKSFEQGAASCEKLNLHANAAFCLAHLGHCQLATGRMALAAESIYRGFQHALQSGHATCVGLLGSLAISHACDRGAGTPETTSVLSLMRRVSDPHSALGRGSMLLADGVGAARAGDLERSLDLLETAAANVEASRSLAFIVCYHRIRVLLSLGDDALAETLCDSMSFLATGSIRREVAGTALHMRGLVAACRKRATDAVALLQQAIAALPLSHYRFDAALDLAWLQLRQGEIAAAARSIETLCGAAALAAESGYLPARIVLRGIADVVQSPRPTCSGWYWGADTLLPSLAVLLVDSRCDPEPARAASDLASLPSP